MRVNVKPIKDRTFKNKNPQFAAIIELLYELNARVNHSLHFYQGKF